MNKIIKTETAHPENREHFTFWLKHHFADGTWICMFKYALYDTDEAERTIVLDYGKDGLIDGRITKDNADTWTEFHGTVNDIVEGKAAIVTYDYGDDGYGFSDHGVTIEAY